MIALEGRGIPVVLLLLVYEYSIFVAAGKGLQISQMRSLVIEVVFFSLFQSLSFYVNHLQHLQNWAARLVFEVSRSYPAQPLLKVVRLRPYVAD